MAEELDMRAAVHPLRQKKGDTGRSPVVRDALALLFAGDAETWRRRYVNERQARLRLEAQLRRIQDAVNGAQ